MFDARLRPLIDPPLNAVGRWLAARGAGANAITLSGMLLAIAAAWTISEAHYLAGLALILANRLFDGLDGAVARQRGMTDFGFFYNTGLAEGAETILAFVTMCLMPHRFALIAWIYAALCLITVVQRSLAAHVAFRD
jgi:phosphatidylglycerophosphate synthase